MRRISVLAMMYSGLQNRRAFTLGEVLVTVALVAVLASVVIPSVASQITKGDLGRISSDLVNTRTGIEQFMTDVRRFPRSIGQLTNKPGTTELPLGLNTAYSAAESARWRGPYLTKDSVAAPATGYGRSMGTSASTPAASIGVFDLITVGTNGVVDTSPNGIKYLVIPVSSVDQATATAIDNAMDDGVLTTGSIRWKAAGDASNGAGAKDTLKYLALPYQ